MPTIFEALAPIIHRVGPHNVWRPIRDRDGRPLFNGVGRHGDILDNALDHVDFSGKTVVDLGCNFGYYAFHAAKKGARRVVGVDIDDRMIGGCQMLRKHYGFRNVDFRSGDFLEEDLRETFDIALMLDYIGKNVIRKQKLIPALKRLSKLARRIVVLSLHPEYNVRKGLETEPDALASTYSRRFIRDGRFDLMAFVVDFFGESHEARMPCHSRCRARNLKHPLLFIRKSA